MGHVIFFVYVFSCFHGRDVSFKFSVGKEPLQFAHVNLSVFMYGWVSLVFMLLMYLFSF